MYQIIINPDPKAADFLVWGVPNSLNISSNGDPGGNWNPGNGLAFVVTLVVVEIFTTDGINLSAKSANDAGASFAKTWEAKLIIKNTINNFFILFILIFYVPDNNKSYYRKDQSTCS